MFADLKKKSSQVNCFCKKQPKKLGKHKTVMYLKERKMLAGLHCGVMFDVNHRTHNFPGPIIES